MMAGDDHTEEQVKRAQNSLRLPQDVSTQLRKKNSADLSRQLSSGHTVAADSRSGHVERLDMAMCEDLGHQHVTCHYLRTDCHNPATKALAETLGLKMGAAPSVSTSTTHIHFFSGQFKTTGHGPTWAEPKYTQPKLMINQSQHCKFHTPVIGWQLTPMYNVSQARCP